MNELSGTIDLESTLVRAEALYRRFQRTVEAVDKKQNFPTPSIRQRKSVTEGPASPPAASSSTDAGKQSVGQAVAAGVGVEKEKVISPELRNLLSRKVDKLDKAQVKKHGGGVGNPS